LPVILTPSWTEKSQPLTSDNVCLVTRGYTAVTDRKRPDTVGQPPSTEIGVPNLPALKAKKLSKLPQEKVLLEL
jgi:hypothetical protein